MMTIHLPADIESSIQAAVHNGHFASVDDALAEAWRAFHQDRRPPAAATGGACPAADPLLGSASDHAELIDQIVEEAMRHREHQPWRLDTSE